MLAEIIKASWKKILRTNFLGLSISAAFLVYALYLVFVAVSPEEAARQSALVFPLLSVLLSSGLIREEFEQNQIYPFLSRFPANRFFIGKALAVVLIIFSIYALLGISSAIMILASPDPWLSSQVFISLLRGFILAFYFTSLGILLANRLKGAANFAVILLLEVLAIILAEKSFGFLRVIESGQANNLTLKNIVWLLILPLRDNLLPWQLITLLVVSFFFMLCAYSVFKHHADKINLKLIEAGAESGFLLKASGLKKTFQEGFLKRKTREALKGVDITIKPGKITGFLGPNGAGKSTTIKIILNFLRPESGTVEFVTGQQSPQRRQHPDIGYLQELAGLFPFLTPRETLYLVARNKGLTWEESAREIQRLAEKLALTEHLDRRLKNLSKGTVQKVALAVAILGQPDLLIFDEPFTGLDPIVMHEIRNLIMELKQAGQTIFLSSHLLPEVERLCEEVILINEGQVVCHGEIEQLKTAWQVAKLIKENPAAGEKTRLILGEEFRDKGFAHLAGSLEKLLQDEMISQNLKQVLVPDLEKLFLESVMGKSTETSGPVN